MNSSACSRRTCRRGFSLVELMVVVGIIALLAAVALPSFLRARKRVEAMTCLATLKMIDSAKDQYALAHKQPGTMTPDATDLAPYVKAGSRLHTDLVANTAVDTRGEPITIGAINTPPKISATTREEFAEVLGASARNFWAGYQ